MSNQTPYSYANQPGIACAVSTALAIAKPATVVAGLLVVAKLKSLEHT